MEKAIIVGLDLGTHRDFAHSMEELEELAIACELEVVGELTQHAQAVNKAFYIGTGKHGVMDGRNIPFWPFMRQIGGTVWRNWSCQSCMRF